MLTSSKREPAYTDTDKMPFGKFEGRQLDVIPAKYLAWLYHELKRDGVDKLNAPTKQVKLFNYIWNSQDAIAEELGEQFP